jgi:hypothetical protein
MGSGGLAVDIILYTCTAICAPSYHKLYVPSATIITKVAAFLRLAEIETGNSWCEDLSSSFIATGTQMNVFSDVLLV